MVKHTSNHARKKDKQVEQNMQQTIDKVVNKVELQTKFNPMMAHRYLQRQVNEVCERFLKETLMNESFRKDFA